MPTDIEPEFFVSVGYQFLHAIGTHDVEFLLFFTERYNSAVPRGFFSAEVRIFSKKTVHSYIIPSAFIYLMFLYAIHNFAKNEFQNRLILSAQ